MTTLTAAIADDITAHHAGAGAASKLPVLRPEDIVITFDKSNRAIAVIPDDVAMELRKATVLGWREFRGQADGQSRWFAPGTWTYNVTAAIIAAYAQTEVPDGLDERDRHFVERGIRAANEWGQCAGSLFIIGRIGWDFEARWWRFDVRSEAHRIVSPMHYPNYEIDQATGRRGIRFSG